jgi:hypothetical protein
MSDDEKKTPVVATNLELFLSEVKFDHTALNVGRDVGLGEVVETVQLGNVSFSKVIVFDTDVLFSKNLERVFSTADPKPDADPPQVDAPDPPPAADLLISLLLTSRRSEAVIGDLTERFQKDSREYGAVRARRLYWGRALRSVWPLLRRAVGRAIRLGAFVEAVRRFF